MTRVFVFAAGSGARWNDHGGGPKQYLHFGGVNLLERTATLVNCYSCELFLVTRTGTMVCKGYRPIVVGETDRLIQSIERTEAEWSERNVFLLGDVFYSRRAINVIFRDDAPFAFYGRPWPSGIARSGHGEMFAMCLNRSSLFRMWSLLAVHLECADPDYMGNLWNIYQMATGLPWGSSRWIRDVMRIVDDYTNDIDSPADLERRQDLYNFLAVGGENTLAWYIHLIRVLPSHWYGIARWWLFFHLGGKRYKRRQISSV